MRRSTLPINSPVNIREFFFLLLILRCLSVISARKQLATSFVWKTGLYCAENAMLQYTVNTFVSSHQRFLLTGVKVGKEAAELSASSSNSTQTNVSLSPPEQYNKPPPVLAAETGYFVPPPSLPPSVVPSSADGIQQWQFDQYLGLLTDLNQNYNYIDNVSTKVNGEKLGTPILRAMNIELDEGLGQVPDESWAVPKNNNHHHQMEVPAFVPDICYSHIPNLYG